MIDDMTMKIGVDAAYREAKQSFDEGGVPVGSALVVDGVLVSVGHNRRLQMGSNVLHGETDCIERAGHSVDFSRSVLFTTLSPCSMCSGAIVLFKIPVVVIMDSVNTSDFQTNEEYLRIAGVDVINHPHGPSIELNHRFQHNPESRRLWLGDVGYDFSRTGSV